MLLRDRPRSITTIRIRRYDFRWEHSADAWFNELLFTYEDAFYNPTAANFGDRHGLHRSGAEQMANDLDVGPAGPRATQNKGQKGPSIADNFTFYSISWHGDHVVKMGFS